MTTSIKTCVRCNNEKLLSEFYRHSAMKDGHLNKCKDCTREDVKRNREKRKEYYKNYDKKRATQPHRVAARHKYQQTEPGKQAVTKAKKEWDKRNPIKKAASSAVGNAVRDGKLNKPFECECCGSSKTTIYGHHEDYSKPLSVRWLCNTCHRLWHAEHGEGLNGNIIKTDMDNYSSCP